MILTDSETNLMVQALTLASSTYVGFAAECETMEGGARIAGMFMAQAVNTRRIAMLIADGGAYISVAGDDIQAHADARRITTDEFHIAKRGRVTVR